MKKQLSLIILLSFCVMTIFAQEKEKYNSIEADFGYFYHFTNTKNNFNYGTSILLSRTVKNLKISAGINYSTKNFYYDRPYLQEDLSELLVKVENKISYINFPILIKIKCCGDKNKALSISSGILFNKVVKYDELIYFDKNSPTLYDKDNIDKQLGVTARLGVNLTKRINNYFRLNLEPFVDYKLILNSTDERPDNMSIPDNRLSLGLKFALEYMF